MAIIWNDLQKVTMAPRSAVNVSMQGALGPGLTDGCEMITGGKGLGIIYTRPEDRPLRGPFTTGCQQQDTLCYEVFMQSFRADQAVDVLLQQECIPPVMLRHISVGAGFANAVLTDGTVIHVQDASYSDRYGVYRSADWTDMLMASCSVGNVAGVKKDGSVLALGRWWDSPAAQLRVATFENAVEAVLSNVILIAITTGGGVLYTDIYSSGDQFGYLTKCQALSNVKKGCIGTDHMLFLHNDGTVTAFNKNGVTNAAATGVASWTGTFVDIAANANTSIGLRDDGTLAASGSYVSEYTSWTDITAIAAGGNWEVVGLKSDGTILDRPTPGGFVTYDSWPGVVQLVRTGTDMAARTPCKVYADGTETYVSLRAKMESMFDYCF